LLRLPLSLLFPFASGPDRGPAEVWSGLGDKHQGGHQGLGPGAGAGAHGNGQQDRHGNQGIPAQTRSAPDKDRELQGAGISQLSALVCSDNWQLFIHYMDNEAIEPNNFHLALIISVTCHLVSIVH
jgi:hypothetical protein